MPTSAIWALCGAVMAITRRPGRPSPTVAMSQRDGPDRVTATTLRPGLVPTWPQGQINADGKQSGWPQKVRGHIQARVRTADAAFSESSPICVIGQTGLAGCYWRGWSGMGRGAVGRHVSAQGVIGLGPNTDGAPTELVGLLWRLMCIGSLGVSDCLKLRSDLGGFAPLSQRTCRIGCDDGSPDPGRSFPPTAPGTGFIRSRPGRSPR